MQRERHFRLPLALALMAAAVVTVGCVQAASRDGAPGVATAPATVTLYCGGGVRAPVAECLRGFERESGIAVKAVFGPSPRMFEEAYRQHGDVYLAGDIHFIRVAQEHGDILARQTVCYVIPVIVVPRGNPKRIGRVGDLGQHDVRFYLVDPKQCQQGFLGERLLAEQGVDAKVVGVNRVSELPAGRDVPSMLAGSELDAAILWQRGARTLGDQVEVIEPPEMERAACPVAAVILRWCRNRPAAEQLLKYLAGPSAQSVFRRHGFRLEPPAATGPAQGSVQP